MRGRLGEGKQVLGMAELRTKELCLTDTPGGKSRRLCLRASFTRGQANQAKSGEMHAGASSQRRPTANHDPIDRRTCGQLAKTHRRESEASTPQCSRADLDVPTHRPGAAE